MTTRTRKVITAIDSNGNAFSEVHTETLVGERWIANDPSTLADGEAAEEWQELYASTLESDRDALQVQVNTLTATVATLTTDRDALQAQVDELLGNSNSDRHVAPYVFFTELLTPSEVIALMTSTDPQIIVGRAYVHSIITYVDLNLQLTIDLVNYAESIGLITEGRAEQILAGESVG